ncbi:hypothetical protein O0R52_21660 (plasmid) [Bacillus halotolerans]|uniref:Uncharacterized protein n=1 Tax=Bacillus halotolerans TaxID=260554 RepID=A0ABY7I6J2_9BACI|nr:hypothetical protein [Bacillus halotolerans]WAT23606.1 hypothetical protein O0R52_21660 [Bacillus halotolerans]
MTSKTMKNLEECFIQAKELRKKFIAVKIEMEGFQEPEIIINPISNTESKLKYYKKTYDEKLKHKYSDGIKMIGFAYGDSMNEIQQFLCN